MRTQKVWLLAYLALRLANLFRKSVYRYRGLSLESIQPEDISAASLIEMQRRLSNSKRPFERVVGTLFLAGILKERLARLTDRQVGQLMLDLVWNQLGLLDPEMTICQHATQRLFRSTGGNLTAEEIERQEQRPACPMCGSEMIHNFGIDEPDYVECARLDCGLRIQAT
jgi:hypothetical protein